ncbi:MAG TPA: DUF4340 domain-containing protein, partial [Polyangiaceae bacterium LLY-WYZ-15_(1-7)]|nr:DUF4340 domain-containing protein [Polyangiaceae bacterium LLY-WYZ-15_(1-7)]
MDKRSTIVLAAIAIGLFAYIVLYERYTITSGELAEVEGQLIERFVRARVNRLVIERPGTPTVEIARDREEQDLLGVWRLERPVEALADSDAVSSLLGAVQYAAARRTLESPSSDELAGFGLSEPRLTATFEVADERIVLRFGSEDPTESGVYMQVGERVHVVGKDLYEALDHPPGHFRSKRLLEEGVVMSESLALTGEGGERRLRRRDARHWDVEVAGGMALASIALVEEALQAFSDLEAESFAPEGEEVDAGLEAPWLRAEALRPTGDDGEGEERVVLKVGAPCGERGEERWARVSVEGEPGPLGCVLTSRLDALTRPLADFREARPITMRDLELQSASLANGAVTLGVAQEQGVWRWTRTERGREESGEVDDQALADWLTEIRRARATLFASAENLAAYGLEAPRATLTVVDQEGIEEQVAMGAVSAEGLYLRRGDEPQILVVPAEAEALFTPSAARLRPRQLWEHPQRAVTRLDLTRGGTRERIEKREGRWTITEPLAVEVDRERVLELARMVARLEAERFVADGPAP